jgi:hypothetical protein
LCGIALIPEDATGLSKSTVKKLVEAAGGLDITLVFKIIVDGEVVGSATLPLTSSTGQILTGVLFDTIRTGQIEDQVADKWDAESLGSFETKQKGGWGDEPATITIELDILDITADDGAELYALIYDSKNKKCYCHTT